MNCYGAKPRSFLHKAPRGQLPALEIDGKFHTESSFIMKLIEETFPMNKPLTPPGTGELMSLERALFGAWLDWLRGDESRRARKTFETAMDSVENALKHFGGPYFLGQELTLADCVFASSLERIA